MSAIASSDAAAISAPLRAPLGDRRSSSSVAELVGVRTAVSTVSSAYRRTRVQRVGPITDDKGMETPPSRLAGTLGVVPFGERMRRIAEEEIVLVVLLAGFGVFFLVSVPPILLVADSWMTLAAGREVWEHGLPSTDTLTVLGEGRTWTDQQWAAQLLAFGTHALGGAPLLAVAACLSVTAAFVLAAAGARSLGADARAIAILLFPVLLAAPWAWTIRAQVFALPLFTGLLWLLAAEARRPSSRVYFALPLLVVWANVHGSAALGAALVITLAVVELVSSRGTSWRRSGALALLAPLALLVTPHGPVATVRYYHLLIVDPPFGDRITEWSRTDPDWNTLFFYALAAFTALVLIRRWRRLHAFDLVVLALTLGNAFLAIRGIVWFSLAAFVLLPPALLRASGSAPSPAARKANRVLAAAAVVAFAGTVAFALARDAAWYEKRWPSDRVVAIVDDAAAAESGTTVFSTSHFADWLLWKIPDLRGRVAYDVRFELYTPAAFDRIVDFRGQRGEDWASLADGYDVLVLEPNQEPSSLDEFAAEAGADVLYQDEGIAVVSRPAR